MRWKITIQAWPHSTGAGAKADQEAAGQRSTDYVVTAQDIKGALVHAEDLQEGIKHNPAVWMAPIMGIVSLPD